MKKWLMLFLTAALLAACSNQPLESNLPRPAPETTGAVANIRGGNRGLVTIELGVANESNGPTAELETFEGQWQLLRADRTVRAGGRLHHLSRVDAGQATFPLSWEGELASGSYTLLWGAPSIGSVVVDFDVAVSDDNVTIRRIAPRAAETYPPSGGFVN